MVVDPMGGEIAIINMDRRHVERVSAIEAECFPSHWSVSAYLNELANPLSRYFCACIDGEVIGFAGYWLIMDEVHITTLAVDHPHRRRGIGAMLLRELLVRARREGARRATLEVRHGNVAAVHLYSRFGFETVGIRRGYYADTGDDAYVMWLKNLWAVELDPILGGPRAAETGKC